MNSSHNVGSKLAMPWWLCPITLGTTDLLTRSHCLTFHLWSQMLNITF